MAVTWRHRPRTLAVITRMDWVPVTTAHIWIWCCVPGMSEDDLLPNRDSRYLAVRAPIDCQSRENRRQVL